MAVNEQNLPKSNRKRKRVSKKSKKSWKKHSDIKDVEGFLEDQRLEERIGGPAYLKKDEELFFVDTVKNVDTAAPRTLRGPSALRAPRCYAGLVPDPRIKPARLSRTEAENEASRKKQNRREEKRLKGRPAQKDKVTASRSMDARSHRVVQQNSQNAAANFDLWGDKDITAPPSGIDEHFLKVCRKMPPKLPKHYRMKPSSVPAVEVAHPGASYNPTFQDHQELLKVALKVEEKKDTEERRLKRAMEDKFPTLADAPSESSWLAEWTAYQCEEDSDSGEPADHCDVSHNPPVRREDKKTERERKRKKELEVTARQALQAKELKVRKQEVLRLKSIKRDLRQRERELAARATKKELLRDKLKDRPKKLGKHKFEDASIAIKLSNELPGALRLLKPEGSLLEERYKSLQKRNIIEPRARAKMVRKYRPKLIEKKNHKNVTI